MIKKSKISPVKVRENPEYASPRLLEFLQTNFNKAIPMSYISGITKKYCRKQVIHRDDKFIQRFSESGGFINTKKLSDYLKINIRHEPGKTLPEESIKRIHQSYASNEGKLTFQYIMKMGEEVGVLVGEKEAKDMVRKYGKRKNFLSLDDCMKLNAKTKVKKNKSKTPKKG